MDFAFRCGYLSDKDVKSLDMTYNKLLAQFIQMIKRPDQWKVP